MPTASSPTPAPRPPADPKPRWGLWFLNSFFLLALSAFILHAWFTSRAAVGLRAVVAAYAQRGEPTQPAQLDQPAVPDAQNAADDLAAAAITVRSTTQPFTDAQNIGQTLPWTRKEQAAVDALLPALGPMLSVVAAAADKPQSDWRVRVRSPSINTLLPQLSWIRELANLTAVAALDAHQRGDDVLALERVRHLLAITRTTDQMAPTLVRHLVAVGVRALACNVIEQITPDLRTDDPAVRAKALALARELLDAEAALRDGQRSALLAERVFILDTAQCLVSGRLTLPQITSMGGGGLTTVSGVVTAAPGGRYLGKPFLLSDARYSMEHTTDVLRAIDNATNWPATAAELARIDKAWDAMWQDGQLHELARVMTPSFERAVLTHYRAYADGRLAATALALRCYATDHAGALPPTLDPLAPAYLPALPIDPFAPDAHAIRYDPRAADPIVYSVDENGIDDKGSEKPKRTTSPTTRASRWQALDAVLHLKRQPRDPESVSPGMRDDDPDKPANADPTQN